MKIIKQIKKKLHGIKKNYTNLKFFTPNPKTKNNTPNQKHFTLDTKKRTPNI